VLGVKIIKTMMYVSALIGLSLIFLTPLVRADVLYYQGLSETGNYGFISNIDGDLSADNFSILRPCTIQSISWYGMYGSDAADAADVFDIRIISMDGTEQFSGSNITGVNKSDSGVVDASGNVIYTYETTVENCELSAGTYLLSISNENDNYSNWFWADGTDGDGISYYWDSGSDAWVDENIGTDMAFTLKGIEIIFWEYVLLSGDMPDAAVTAGSSTIIYGTADPNHITVGSGSNVQLFHFPGTNTITLPGMSGQYSSCRSGACVTLQGSDGTMVRLPATTYVQTIEFEDGHFELVIIGNQVMLADMEIPLCND